MDSDLDTVFVNLRIDDDSTFINSQPKTGTLSAQGSWTSRKVLYVILIALCIIAIILAVLFLVLGKKFKKNKRSAPAGTTTVTRSIVTKGVSPDPKYQPVRNV